MGTSWDWGYKQSEPWVNPRRIEAGERRGGRNPFALVAV